MTHIFQAGTQLVKLQKLQHLLQEGNTKEKYYKVVRYICEGELLSKH